NRSRAFGQGARVLVNTSVLPPTVVEPDESLLLTFLDPGTWTVTVDLPFAGDHLTTSMDLVVGGTPRAPTIVLQSVPTTGAQGSEIPLEAVVSLAAGGPAAGRSVRFSIGPLSATVGTDADGLATARLHVNLSAGTYSVVADVLDDGGAAVAS